MNLKSFLFLFCLFIVGCVFAQLNPEDISIPMRDGKNLAADLYLPDQSGSFPVILIQTPYNKNTYRTRGLPLGVRYDITSSNYAFVIADWRCFFGSMSACSGQANRDEDGFDTVEWIAEQTWSNGKVGTWGPSALGGVQFNTAYLQPPHLVCAVPEVCAPQTAYSDFYPGGTIIAGRVKTLNVLYGNAFNPVIANPFYNNIWQFIENSSYSPELVDIPMLLVAGWYDHNTNVNFGLLESLQAESGANVRNQHKLLVGPWVHGGTGQAFVGSANQGELMYENAALKNHEYENAFFDYYLRDIQNGWEDTATVVYYQMGANTWQNTPQWPPATAGTQTFYLAPDGVLATEIPSEASVSFDYDPEDPSPSTGGKTLTPGLEQGPLDQRFAVENRDDAITFTSAVLPKDLELRGTTTVTLHVSTNKRDTDFMLRLTVVYPDGRSMLLGEATKRLRYRNGFREDDIELATPGEVYALDFAFEELANTFLEGQRIRLVLTGSNYPHYGSNMNTGEAMYPDGNPDTLVNPEVATNTIWMGAARPSRITFPVTEALVGIADRAMKEELRVFPNPSSGVVAFPRAWEDAGVTVYTMAGRVAHQSQLTGNRLNLQHLPEGCYWLDVSKGGGHARTKVVMVGQQ